MAEEFVQVVKLKVDDSGLRAAIDFMKKELGNVGATIGSKITSATDKAAAGAEKIGKGFSKADKEAKKTAKDAKDIAKGTKEAKKETDGLAKSFKGMAGAVKGLVAAYVGFKGISAIVGFGKGSIEAFNVQNRAERMLEFGMRQNGTAERADELKRYASTIQGRTIYGDEAMLSAAAGWQNKIRSVENSKRMMDLVADFAAKSTGGGAVDAGSMKGFSQQLMQALSGRAITLKAQGFDISAINKLQEIRSKGGKVTEDMEIAALEKVLAPIRGMAQELANTDEGKIQQLKNTIGDMREEVGRQLMPVVSRLAENIRKNLPSLKKLFESLGKVFESLVNLITENIGTISTFVNLFAKCLDIFAKFPIEITSFIGLSSLLKQETNSTTLSLISFGKGIEKLGKGGLLAACAWSIGKIIEAAGAVIDLANEKIKEQRRADYTREENQAIEAQKSISVDQENLRLNKDELEEVKKRFKKHGLQGYSSNGLSLNYTSMNYDPSVGKLFGDLYGGLNDKQKKWIEYEVMKQERVRKQRDAVKKRNMVNMEGSGNTSGGTSSFDELEKQIARQTKGDTNITNIKYTNNITTDSDLVAKSIKENLRTLLTSQLNFTSRTSAAKALAI